METLIGEEGFICPSCMTTFKTQKDLIKHHSESHLDIKEKVEHLKQTGTNLLKEINLLKLCLQNGDEPDSVLESPRFTDEECELFISNDGDLVQFCVKTLKTQEIEYTVSKQLQKELEDTLEKMKKDHEEIQKRLDNLLKEKEQILDEYDKLLFDKDESLKNQKKSY